MEKRVIERKSEKGAITLFVLLACLFFVFILTGVYISTINKLQVQEQEVKQIQDNYAKELNNINEIYEELNIIIVKLSQNPGKDTWANEKVVLTGTATVKEEGKIITAYAFSKDSTDESSLEWTEVDNKTSITVTEEVDENGKYYFWVKDEDGNIKKVYVNVNNIDKIPPTVGSLIAKVENAEGEDYTYNTWIDKSVYIEKVDGTDNESGHKSTTYSVLKNGLAVEEWTDIQEPITLTQSGEYTITLKTEDNAGNIATSITYTVKIDKAVPILSLKHNDTNGAEYEQGTWTKDVLYGEINIDNGRPVEKYQYSENGVVWNDISAEPVVKSFDYTTTFPMSDKKPEWITGPINANSSTNSNGKYYFEIQEDGTLKPNNRGINSTSANSYFEIDLTDYPDASLDITINATISSESYDKGSATIQGENDSSSKTIINSTGGNVAAKDYSIAITGGQKYTLTIKYSKDSSVHKNDDTFTINNISLKSEQLGRGLNFADYLKIDNKVTFKFNEDMEQEVYLRAVYEGGEVSNKVTDKVSIKIDKKSTTMESSDITILSQTEAKTDIKVKENASGFKGYYISTEETEPTENTEWIEQSLKEFSIEGLNTGTTYYLWLIDNAGNISKNTIEIGNMNYLIDDTIYRETLADAISAASDGSTIQLLNDYTDTSEATFDKNITFDVQEYTLTRDKTLTINTGKTVEITGTGKITTGTVSARTITNNGTLTLSNSVTIENMSTSSSYAPICSNNNNSVTNINNNVKIIGNYYGIYNSYGTVNVNGGYIEATHSSGGYAISNINTSKVYINAGEIKGYYGTYNADKALVEIIEGKVVGTGGCGIYAKGTTNIYGGRIEGKTYGIQGNISNKITIGRQEEELSTSQPAVYGESYGIYMQDTTYSFNFYNGVIISNTKDTSYRGMVNLRTGYISYTYLDYDVEENYCTILTPKVTNITMEANPTEYTNENVIVKITYPNTGGLIKQYSEDGVEWKVAEQYIQEVNVTENKTIYARTIDESEIIIEEKQIEVNNIDKERPIIIVAPTETSYVVTDENETKDISVTIKATDTGVSGLDIMQYAFAKEGEEITYIDFTNEITIDKNNLSIGQYYLYLNVTDKAGNTAELNRIRYNIQLKEPVAQIGETKYLTIQEAVEACEKDTTQDITIDYTTTFPMSDEKPEWITGPIANGIYYFETQEDGTLKSNNKGVHNSKANSYFEIDLESYIKSEVEINITLNTTISSQNGYDYGYATITEDTMAPNPDSKDGRFIYVSNTITSDYTTTLTGGKKYYLHIGYYKNSSGSNYEDIFIINNIKITGKMNNQVVKQPTTIKLLKNTDEEFETYKGQNLILDLQGYTVGSSNQEIPLCTNNAELQIIDTSTEKTGKIESFNKIGILNKGKLIIGDNSTNIDLNTPTIYGKQIGIKNENIFRFFDGKIQGIAPIQGNTNSTPDGYGPVSTEYSEGITTIQLGIVSEYEARVGWVYYTKVQEAINATRGNKKQTVTIIKDIQLRETLNVNMAKDIILDLDGHTLGIVPEKNNVINNYGNLEITDSDENQQGTIKAENASSSIGIYNGDTGNIKVSGGTIKSSSSSGSAYGIYNNSTGQIKVTGGTIKSISGNTADGYGIYNSSTGSIEVTGGIIISSISSGSLRMVYGIYNRWTGSIVLTGGIVSSSGSYSYGIYNASTGSIVVKDGTVSGISQHSGTAIYNGKGNLELMGGNVNSYVSDNTGNNTHSYGIRNSTGNVEITGGIISSNNTTTYAMSYGIENIGGTIKVKGGIISSNGTSIGNGINNEGNVEVTGGIISGESSSNNSGNGISNSSTGTVIVTGGMVSGKKCGIYNGGTGSIIIGTKENALVSSEEPNIIQTSSGSKGYGIDNSLGDVEFYNGRIEGNLALLGSITKVREGYEITKEQKESTEVMFLKQKEIEGIVQIKEKKYTSLQEAIDSIGDSEQETIQIIKDFELKESIKFNKNIILDLNGKNIKNYYYKIENSKELKIIDSTEEKQGKIESINTIYGISNLDGGNITIEGGTISSTQINYTSNYAIYNRGTGKIKITGGTIRGSYYGIYNASTGTVEIIGGILSNNNTDNASSAYGIYNASTGTVEIIDGTLNNSANSLSYGIYNANKGDIKVTGGTINSFVARTGYGERSYGIYNASTGNVEITGGMVSGAEIAKGYGVYNNTTGSIIVGIKGDGLVSAEEPYIKANYGIYNVKGKFNFYDGKIEGKTKAVNETISEIEENTELNYNEDETILTLSGEITDIAQIGETTYASLQEATEVVGTKQATIKLLRNATFTNQDTAIIVPSTKNIILDLNGYKIKSAIPEKTIHNEGILEIIDTSTEQTGTITTNEETTINNANAAKLVISGGTIINRLKQSIYNEGEVIVTGGTVDSGDGDKNYGIYNVNKGTVKITGGMVKSSDYGIYNASTGNIELEEGTVSSKSAIDMNDTGIDCGIYNASTGDVKITGGIINCEYNSYGYGYGIYNESSGNIEITGGTISVNEDYGIYNASNGTITIGTKGDGVVLQEIPLIESKKIGINNQSGILQYYDGVIKAKDKVVSGNITEIEDNTELLITTETISYTKCEVATLEQTIRNPVSVNGTEYGSIQKAVEACGDTESIITILRDVNPAETIIIEQSQNITLDLNGYTLNNYQEITNKGTLKITDTSEAQTGKVLGLSGTAISNEGTMELQSGSISDSGYGINNKGTLTISGGTIKNNTYGIYNILSGRITIENGTISSNTYGIYVYNNSINATTNINGGNIISNDYGIYAASGTVIITSTGITSNTYGLYNAGGTTNIKEGSAIQSNTGIYNSSGIVTIGERGTMNADNPIITGEEYGLYNAGGAIVYMYDGQIKGKTGATQGYVTYTENGYSVANKTEGEYNIDYLTLSGTISTVAQVNGIDFSNLQSAINSVTGEEVQTIKLTNGINSSQSYTIAEGQNIILDMNGTTITSDQEVTITNAGTLTIIDSTSSGNALISSTVGTAISNSGTLTLGADDGTVSQELLTIDGTTNGIENSGILNFYDGTINGASAVSGTITNRATGYVIRTTTVNSKERYYLST